MTTKSTISQDLQDEIKKGMIQGYKDNEGTKVWPTLKKSAKYYNISYDALRQIAKDWDWREERKKWKIYVHRKSLEIKKNMGKCEDESACEAEAEELVINDIAYNSSASRLRVAVDLEVTRIIDGNCYLYSTKDGNPVYGVPSNAAYRLMNLGKSLESAQKVAKLAAGEPSDIQKIEGAASKYHDKFNSIMDNALGDLEQDEDGNPE
ncbi:MAG: hypothetical protein NKF70_00130 [Methanobacterium sp. ERen5]|nr:MAG: hypothetical protein NKF70_00130 [Methanobacterium sp. ERen5]